MVATAVTPSSSQLLCSSSRSISQLSPLQQCVFGSKTTSVTNPNSSKRNRHVGVKCMAVAAETEPKKKSGYQITTLTSWLLEQEQKGVIDAELTIVLSSISLACKQIASLVQRASISNLTGVQGAVKCEHSRRGPEETGCCLQ